MVYVCKASLSGAFRLSSVGIVPRGVSRTLGGQGSWRIPIKAKRPGRVVQTQSLCHHLFKAAQAEENIFVTVYTLHTDQILIVIVDSKQPTNPNSSG